MHEAQSERVPATQRCENAEASAQDFDIDRAI